MEVKHIIDWEVFTNDGWKSITGIKKTSVPLYCDITYNETQKYICSPTHKIKVLNGSFKNAMDLFDGEVLYNGQIIKTIELIYGNMILFDLLGVDGLEYNANDIVNHNCAFISDIDKIWAATQQTLATGGKAIALSCVTEDTYIFTNKGLKQIKDFIPNNGIVGDYKIRDYNILGVDYIRNGSLFKNSGITDTIKIKTKFGSVEGSKIHQLWSYKTIDKKFGWYKLEDLTTDDFVSIQYGMNIWGNNDDVSKFNELKSKSKNIKIPFNCDVISKELAYLFGLYISEGSSYKTLNKDGKLIGGNITITCGDKDIIWVFDALNLKYYTDDYLHYLISSKNLIELFEFVGFDLNNKANNKIIPNRLLEMSSELISYMLKGIFDGDGCSSNGNISLTSTSKILIDQVRLLLNNFGILCSCFKYTKEQMNSYKSKIKYNYDVYRLETYGKNSIKFFNLIGFCIERKSKNKEILLKKNLFRNCSKDIIPNSLELVNKLYDNSKENTKTIKEKFGLFLNSIVNKTKTYKTNNISRSIVKILYDQYKYTLSDVEINYYDKIISDNLCWVKVDDISFNKQNVYDFSLPEILSDDWCHSIIYNGFVGHQTPNGLGNWFHKTWSDSIAGLNKFKPSKLHWSVHPDRNQKWRDDQDKILGEKMAKQECDSSFLSSGNSFIPMETILWYSDNNRKEPLEKRGVDGGLWIWEYADYSKNYVLCGDVARGDGEDFSAFHVLEIETLRQVAEYKGKLSTKDFGNLCVNIANEYNNALLVIENSNIGWASVQVAIDRNYPNLFYSSKDMTIVDTQISLSKRYDLKDKSQLIPGFSTTSKSRPLILSKLDEYMRNKDVTIYSKRLLDELMTFVWNSSRAEAMVGYNDDLVMAYSIGLWVRDTSIRLRQQGIDLQRNMISNINRSDPIMVKNNVLINNPWELSIRGEEKEDLSWLIK